MSFSPSNLFLSPPSSPYEMVPFGQTNLITKSRSSSVEEDEDAEDIYNDMLSGKAVGFQCFAEITLSSSSSEKFNTQWKYSPHLSFAEGGFYYAVFQKTMASSAHFYYDRENGLSSRIVIHLDNPSDQYVLSSNTFWCQDYDKFMSFTGKIIINLRRTFNPITDSAVSFKAEIPDETILLDSADNAQLSEDCSYEISSIHYRTILNY